MTLPKFEFTIGSCVFHHDLFGMGTTYTNSNTCTNSKMSKLTPEGKDNYVCSASHVLHTQSYHYFRDILVINEPKMLTKTKLQARLLPTQVCMFPIRCPAYQHGIIVHNCTQNMDH